jgi:uncharacterized protein YabE (DUF348 family)
VVEVSARRAAHRRPTGVPRRPGAPNQPRRTSASWRPEPRLEDVDGWLAGPVPPAEESAPATDRVAAIPPAAAPRVPRRLRTAARAAVLAVLLTLVAGSAAAVAADKNVTVTVDGRDRVVHTFARNVAGALASAGLGATPQDRVEPAPATELADGDHVIVARARPLTLVEGPSERRIWTTAASVDEALRDVGVEAQPIQMSTAPNTTIPLDGLAVELRVPRAVTFVDGTHAPEPVTTTAGTVAALLVEKGVTLGPDDVAVPAGDTPLTEGTAVQVVRNGVGEVVETRRIAPPEDVVDDPDLPRGRREVVEKGKPGEQTVVMRVHVQNGTEVRREQVRAGATTPPQKRVIRLGTNDDLSEKAAAPSVGPGVWDALARCEAGGSWDTNSGNGYYGGLQFDRRTWLAYDGDQYAPLPHQAERDAQIAVASKVRDDRGGYGSWPACARKLGLPT